MYSYVIIKIVKNKNVTPPPLPPKKMQVSYLHPTLPPVVATSLQWPFYFVPKVAVGERFDCKSINKTPQLQICPQAYSQGQNPQIYTLYLRILRRGL